MQRLAVVLFLSFAASTAHAEEPLASGEPRYFSENAEATNVVDAFDRDNPFDLHLSLAFLQSWKTANIRRESELAQPGLSTGGFTARTENVARYSSQTSTLLLGADIGVFRDLALVVRLPIILAYAQELSGLSGSEAVLPARLADPQDGTPLFSLPTKSPTRGGIDWFSVGVDYSIVNQRRKPTMPTWVLGFETRFGVGAPLHACNASAPGGSAQCPDPGAPRVDRDPGISRAMNAVGAHTIISRRFGYLEPYTGFWFLAEFPQDRGDFGKTNDAAGILLNRPPLRGTFGIGLEVVPFEQREQAQRLAFDVRAKGTYHSPGREYSELFDALGSSQAPSLRNPNPASYIDGGGGTSIADPNAAKVYFTGITDTQAFASFGADARVVWQAGRAIKFQAGGGIAFVQSHLITGADACNPDFKSDPSRSGPCRGEGGVTGIPNPNHRDVLDLPGRRFSADDTKIVHLSLSGTVMF